MKYKAFIIVFFTNLALAGGTYATWGTFYNGFSEKPKDITNVCSIFAENPDWEEIVYEASEKWEIPVSVFMAMIYQESSFVANARPRDASGKLLSSAYGYSQALDQTWEHYLKSNNISGKKRDDFEHALDFMGWYNSVSIDKNKVSPNRPDLLYLNYHEGWGGFKTKTYMKKPELIRISRKVYNNTINYSKQLSLCPANSDKSAWADNGSSAKSSNTTTKKSQYKKWN